MTHEEKSSLNKSAKSIIAMAKSKKDAEKTIAEILVNCVLSGMETERNEWIRASEVLGPKTREKLMKERKL